MQGRQPATEHRYYEAKIMARHIPSSYISALGLFEDIAAKPEKEQCVFISEYEFYLTYEREGRLLPCDYDMADQSKQGLMQIVKLGYLCGSIVLGRECGSLKEIEQLKNILGSKRLGIREVYDALPRYANSNIYMIHILSFEGNDQATPENKKRIVDEISWRVRKHEHVNIDAIAFVNNDMLSEQEVQFREYCGFRLVSGVYVKEL